MKRLVIEKNFLFYIFLLIVPFFNIIIHRYDLKIVLIITILFVVFNLFFYKVQSFRRGQEPLLFILFFLTISLFFSETHSLIIMDQSNFKAIRFFGLFLVFLIYSFLTFNLNIFLKKYLNKILTFYILTFSISIIVDYIILHSILDISLQPMYSKYAYSYMDRPFGITGQPSVNSILLVFFYSFLLSNKEKSKILFLFVTVGIALQGSGSGFIAYLMLLVAMLKNVNHIYKSVIYLLLPLIFLTLLDGDFLNKISYEYVQRMIQILTSQTQEWLDSINSYSEILFGGTSSGIDFGIAFLISNVGLVYFFVLSSFFMYLILKADSHYDRMAIYILLIGNLHYPVLFYLLMVFVLPMFMYKVLYVRFPENKPGLIGRP
jgi:hypothetical protein